MDTVAEHSSFSDGQQPRGRDWLRIDVPRSDDGSTVRLGVAGQLDRDAAGQLRQAVADVLSDTPPTHLEIDVAEVTFLDSSGIRCLLICRKLAKERGCRLTVAAPTDIVYQVLEITGLLDTFAIPQRTGSGTVGSRLPISSDPVAMEQIRDHSAELRLAAQATRQRAEALRDTGLPPADRRSPR